MRPFHLPALVLELLIVLVVLPTAPAFLTFPVNRVHGAAAVCPPRSLPSTLHGGFLEDLLGGMMGKGKPAGPETILDVPATQLKVGALRFLLQIHLVGEQNKPQPGSWFTKQGDEPGELQVYYQDGSGMLGIQLEDYGVKFIRHGEKPSLQYRLQESVLLHSVLDELAKVALEMDDIPAEKRLLTLLDAGAIEAARATLPARPASTAPADGA